MWDSGSRLGSGLEALLSLFLIILTSLLCFCYICYFVCDTIREHRLNHACCRKDFEWVNVNVCTDLCFVQQSCCLAESNIFQKNWINASSAAAASSSSQMCTVFVRNWSIANQSGSLLIQREPNCVKLIKSDRCVCFHSWLRCSAEPLSLYFIKILPKSIKGSVFYTLTLSLIKLALIILADDWSLAKKTWTILGYMSWTLWSSFPLSWAAQLKGQNFKHMLVMTVNY